MSQEFRIGVNYADPAVNDCVEKLFRTDLTNPPRTLSHPWLIYQSLVGINKRFRNEDHLPKGSNEERNVQVVNVAVEPGIPIPVVVAIGTLLDHSAQNPEAEDSGVLGALAVNRILHLESNVRRIYPEGLDVVVFADDYSGHLLFDPFSSHEEVRASQSRYISSWEAILNTMQDAYGARPVRLVRESDMCQKQGIDFTKYKERWEENFQALVAYITESNPIIESQKQMELSSYKELEALGWSGTIPSEMRVYYRDKIGRDQPELEEDMLDQQIARLFAASLTKRQYDLIRGSVYGLTPLRPSFLKQPPGTPESYWTFIGISAHPVDRRYSENKQNAPWTGRAHIEHGPDKTRLKIRSPRDVDLSQIEGVKAVEQATLTVNDTELIPIQIGLF